MLPCCHIYRTIINIALYCHHFNLCTIIAPICPLINKPTPTLCLLALYVYNCTSVYLTIIYPHCRPYYCHDICITTTQFIVTSFHQPHPNVFTPVNYHSQSFNYPTLSSVQHPQSPHDVSSHSPSSSLPSSPSTRLRSTTCFERRYVLLRTLCVPLCVRSWVVFVWKCEQFKI